MDGTLTWHEAWSLVERLALDPSSHLRASIVGWKHPLSREGMALADLYDVTVAAHTDKRRRRSIKPYPRPWKHARGARSKAPVVDQATVRALLDARRPRPAGESTSDDQEVTHGR